MRTIRLTLTLALLMSMAASFGCAFGEMRWNDPLQREISLEDAQDRYTVLVRWSKFDEAAGFVDPEMRDDYIRNFPNFRDFRFTDSEQEPLNIDEELVTATLVVTYFVYTPYSPVETEIRETQVWYRDPGVANRWHVRPTFDGVDEILAARSGR